jgi:hypothetical protein
MNRARETAAVPADERRRPEGSADRKRNPGEAIGMMPVGPGRKPGPSLHGDLEDGAQVERIVSDERVLEQDPDGTPGNGNEGVDRCEDGENRHSEDEDIAVAFHERIDEGFEISLHGRLTKPGGIRFDE